MTTEPTAARRSLSVVLAVLRSGLYVACASSTARCEAREHAAEIQRVVNGGELMLLRGVLLDGARERGAGDAHGEQVWIEPQDIVALALYSRDEAGHLAFDEDISLDGRESLAMMSETEFQDFEARQAEWSL